MSSDALELALALHRAPIRRFTLRDRPLPDDIGEAIRLASAPQPLLGDCAKRLCVPPATLLEAIRFYLQQVLFEPGTDAYRVLGANADAPTGLIRDHYHWLQRWLHPDRRGEDWEALLATRITWAWGHLRNNNVRAAYDAERERQRQAPTSEGKHTGVGAATVDWKSMPVSAPRTSWLTRILVGLSFASCLGLLVLALTRHDQLPTTAAQTANTTSLATVTTGLEQHRSTPASIASAAATQAMLPAPPATLMSTATIAATNVARIAEPTIATRVADQHQLLAEAPSALPPEATPVPAARQAAIEPVARSQPSASKPGTRQQPVPGTASLATTAAPPPPAAPARVSAATSDDAATPTSADASAMTIAVAAPVPPTPAEPPASLLERTDMARQRVEAVVAYFRRTDNARPAWQDARGPHSAQLERAALRQRFGADAALFALDPPVWNLSAQMARLDTTYHIRHQGEVLASGRFSLRMAWTDGAWQLARVKLDSAP